jgi:molybdopterin-containing oxidoreductase family membrane subunit
MEGSRLKRSFWIAGATLFALGLLGWYDRLAHGHQNAAYGSIVTWGLWVAAYTYFSGLSAGAFLISSLGYVFGVRRYERIGRLALFTAVVTLFLALLSISVDLGHMGRAWHVMAYPNFKSPMAWMIWLYAAYLLILIAELWFVLRRDLVVASGVPGARAAIYRVLVLGAKDVSDRATARDRRLVRALGTIGVLIAVIFPGGVGALFGVVAARPHWHSGMYPVLFMISALVSGTALLTLVAPIFQEGWRRNRDTVVSLGRLVLALLLLDVLFQASEMLVAFYGGIPGQVAALELVLGGPYWWVFWGWQLGAGTLVPIALLALPTRDDPRFVSLAGLLVAAAFLGVRLNVVIPGLAAEEIRGISEALASVRMTTHYFPSVTEWLVTLGVGGLGLLLFGLGELLLPKEEEEAAHVRA